MDEEEFTELLRLADVKKDGVIKYKSFVEMVEGKKRKGKKKRAIESISWDVCTFEDLLAPNLLATIGNN